MFIIYEDSRELLTLFWTKCSFLMDVCWKQVELLFLLWWIVSLD